MQPINRPSIRNYNNVSTRNNGFQYKLMPLSFNLQLKGNCKLLKTSRMSLKIGDFVYGICVDDDKRHKGTVTNITFKDEKAEKPLYVYIIDNVTRKIIKLKYNTIHILSVRERYSFDLSIMQLNEKLKINNKKYIFT